MTDYMLLPNQSSFAVHDVHDITNKEAPATDYYYYWQAVVGGKHKIKHASLSVVRLWGILDVVLVVIHYDTLQEMKRLIVALRAHWLFLSPPDALCLPGRADIM